MLCDRCGKEIPDGSTQCPHCGETVERLDGETVDLPPTDTPTPSQGGTVCPSCGAPLTAEALFCGACGAKLGDAAPIERPAAPDPFAPAEPFTPPVAPPPPELPTPPESGSSDGEDRPTLVHAEMGKLFTSTLVLVGLIANTVALVMSVCSSLMTCSTGMTAGAVALDTAGLSGAVGILAAVTAFVSLLAMAPSILAVVAQWMVYRSYKGSADAKAKLTGMTIIKVVTIISLVVICIVFGIALLGSLVVMTIGTASGELSDMMSGMNITGLLLALSAPLAGLMIAYYVLSIKTVNTMRTTMLTGVPSDKVSGYVAVLTILGGVISGINTLGALIADPTAVLSNASSATASICFGIFLFNYRTKMRELML